MVVLVKKRGESKDALFRKFSRTFMDENVVDEVRKRLFYKKPSRKRKDDEKERMRGRARKRLNNSISRARFQTQVKA